MCVEKEKFSEIQFLNIAKYITLQNIRIQNTN